MTRNYGDDSGVKGQLQRRKVFCRLRHVIALGFFILTLAWFWGAARYLVVDEPLRSDLIVILGGGDNERSIDKALFLLADGYAKQVVLDENRDVIVFGFPRAQLAREFVEYIATNGTHNVDVCPIEGRSIVEETRYAARCISHYDARSVPLVAPDFRTRRALLTFSRMLPQYRWSISAASDPSRFAMDWWKHREWAKNTATEWASLVWWEVVERW